VAQEAEGHRGLDPRIFVAIVAMFYAIDVHGINALIIEIDCTPWIGQVRLRGFGSYSRFRLITADVSKFAGDK
jgi:hypothetical protein